MRALAAEAKTVLGGYYREYLTTPRRPAGWRPGCACDAGAPVPCRVLDPFGGAGTTALAADRLGVDAVLIEVSPASAELARDRLTADAPLFVTVHVEAGRPADPAA